MLQANYIRHVFYSIISYLSKLRIFFYTAAALHVLVLYSCHPDKRNAGTTSIKGSVTYYHDIAPIITSHCMACHSEKGPGPINLGSYASVSYNAAMIKYVVNRHIMPPWLADGQGWHFANSRVLSQHETDMINKWCDNGMYKGDSIAPEILPPALPDFGQRKPDIVLLLDKALHINGNNQESFIKTSFAFKSDSAFPVEAIEIVSKQMKVAHHAYFVIKGNSNFKRSQNQFLLGDDLFQDSSVVMISAWAPGSGGVHYPDGFGFYLPKAGEVDLEFHYGPSPIELEDSVEVHLYKARKPITRTCTFLSISGNDKANHLNPPVFEIPPYSRKKFTMQYRVAGNITVMMVAPHMHYLGKTFHVTATLPDGRTMPVINLSNWNFSWQDQYLCQPFHYLPKGSVLNITAEYDNTASNVRNPSNPPRTVHFGWETRSEMMVFILMITQYTPGDEQLGWNAR